MNVFIPWILGKHGFSLLLVPIGRPRAGASSVRLAHKQRPGKKPSCMLSILPCPTLAGARLFDNRNLISGKTIHPV